MTHREICERGANWLKNSPHWMFRSQYVLIEFVSACPETPDIFGLRGAYSILIEVKISKSDFKADFKKKHRIDCEGIGRTRYYLCPTNLIKPEEVPEKWGLLYITEKGVISVIKSSETFEQRNFHGELGIMQSVLRRIIDKPKVLDFRIKKEDISPIII